MFFSCKQKTAYGMRISDWSSDVCSSDLEHLWLPASGRPLPALEVGLAPLAEGGDPLGHVGGGRHQLMGVGLLLERAVPARLESAVHQPLGHSDGLGGAGGPAE